MDFLVRIDTRLPPDMPVEERAGLLAREAERGRQLRAAGVIREIWRVPGRLSNVAIWSVTGADQLDALISGLPLWRWMDVDVTALAPHPLMKGGHAD